MIPTTHACKRMEQRAIPADFVELLGCFGIALNSRHGVDKLALPRREAKHLRRRIESLLHRWDHLVDAYAVVSDADILITTAHTTHRAHRRRMARPSITR
ncbi:hypothetical protein [Stenotrophomonas sp. ZAC14A_NAIMI4_1]|uniref:hypothetical protein n=1 Tax=Stenotrophomonas sp. ZAC14A_NAIMI4_1 TaxID=2072412 RepID=UPI000D540209|nr:hypothetical protein [Stenotrophomonas sp. ZAC14A_NAIMI4_1]AWH45375.1 hypothetical protein C1926_10200 [Stenotrophomonas sp. ZAC14A_NAIMI4_1]